MPIKPEPFKDRVTSLLHLEPGASERFNQMLFEHATSGLALCQMDGTLVHVNSAYAQILGRSIPETIGLTYWQVTPKSYAAQEAAQFKLLGDVGQYGPYEKEYIHADGHLVPVRLSGRIVEISGERLIWSSVEDITERKRAERALRESEERFRLAASGGDVWGWDIGANSIQFPPEFWRKLGYDNAQIDDPMCMFESVLHPDDRARWKKALKDHICSRVPYDLDYRARTLSGEYRWFHTSGQARWNDAGLALFMAGTTFDISERKQAELELKQSEERFRLAASTGDVWGWDIVTNQYSFSPEFWRKLGYEEADIGDPLQMFEAILHPDDNAGWRQALRKHLREHLPYRLDLRFRTTQGEYRWFHTRGQARWDDSGRAVYMAGTTFDITKRKHVEAQILQLNADLEKRVAERTAELAAANRELETFAYSVSHDLKAPLRGIDGYSQLLQETCADELSKDARIFVQNIRDGSAQMNGLIDDLLDYSRMERRQMRSMRLDLDDAVRSVLAERASEIEARGVRLQVQLPALSVQADPDGLAVALRNLLENALKFTHGAQPPVIEVGGREEPNSCILWVKDNGIGFDMKFHDRIFEIFQRLQRTEDYPGTGIGLALVSKAMHRMGGRVWAQSAPGQGATFYLELPK